MGTRLSLFWLLYSTVHDRCDNSQLNTLHSYLNASNWRLLDLTQDGEKLDGEVMIV